jgi:hypothetical protein
MAVEIGDKIDVSKLPKDIRIKLDYVQGIGSDNKDMK